MCHEGEPVVTSKEIKKIKINTFFVFFFLPRFSADKMDVTLCVESW